MKIYTCFRPLTGFMSLRLSIQVIVSMHKSFRPLTGFMFLRLHELIAYEMNRLFPSPYGVYVFET